MSQPTSIQELVYDSSGNIDSTRTTNSAGGSCFWKARNLPSSGFATLDSTTELLNCEVIKFVFSGHGSGNYVTNFKYFVTDQNAVAQDMTNMFRADSSFTDPSSYSDADIYTGTDSWAALPTSVPVSANISKDSSFSDGDDPIETEYIYNAVVIAAGAATGTASWKLRLLYQYT